MITRILALVAAVVVLGTAPVGAFDGQEALHGGAKKEKKLTW